MKIPVYFVYVNKTSNFVIIIAVSKFLSFIVKQNEFVFDFSMYSSVFKSLRSAKHPVPVFTKNVTFSCAYKGVADAILSFAGLLKINHFSCCFCFTRLFYSLLIYRKKQIIPVETHWNKSKLCFTSLQYLIFLSG